MVKDRTYIDYNASAPLRPLARKAMLEAFDLHGNASSVHSHGRNAKRLIEKARKQVADLVNADVEGVIFTSGATEAAHLALTPHVVSGGTSRTATKLFVLETEHPCILAGGRFAPEDTLAIPVLANGLIDEPAFDALMAEHKEETVFVALQLANSETGVIQPVAKIAQKVRFAGGYVFCDAVQAAGRIPIDAKDLGVDLLAVSAHKLGGPQGVGALIIAHMILELSPAIRGGGQEKNRRAGTENVAAIAGFGVAAEEAAKEAEDYGRISTLRDSIETGMAPICNSLGLERDLTIFCKDAKRVGNTVLFSLKGLRAETALIAFDLDGVSLSSGSACSSGKVGSSHVLQAMGADQDVAQGALRVSLGWASTEDDVEKFLKAFERVATRLAERQAKAA